MRKNYTIALIIFLATILIVGGCSDRGSKLPTGSDIGADWGVWPDQDWSFKSHSGAASAPPQLLFQLRNPDALLHVETYIPKISWPAPKGEGLRVPLLVLLAPENESEYFYRDRGLYQLANQMIESGEIQPMMIACVTNDPTFGGYFYGNSYAAGMYDGIFADTMSYLDSDLGLYLPRGILAYYYDQLGELLIDSPNKRGIGGVGQGAYGAFRAILKHPGVYNSITVADGPLSFEDGLDDLFGAAIAEQQVRWIAKGKSGTFNDISLFDTLVTMPLSRMFVGGAIAFSPNDTLITYTFKDGPFVSSPDLVTINSRNKWTDQSVDTSATLVDSLIKAVDGDWDFHMPFDVDGVKNTVQWQRWMDNDLATLRADAPADALDSVSIWIGTSSQAKWNYSQMTKAWIATLGSDVDEVFEYQGYTGNDTNLDNQYVYDLMKRMLKFHSDKFGTD